MDASVASPKVLVVDDDPDVLASLERGLRLSGFDVFTAVDGAEALRSATETRPDAIVLDINMPVLDGVSVVTALRAMDNDVPVCVLSARSSVDDRVAGLEAGADDYLVKPFALRELLARVNALLRRTKPARDLLGYADLTLDVTSHSATRAGVPIVLTKIEFALLELLARNAEQVLSYDVITDRVWGYGEAPASNALQVFVALLRRKLEADGLPRLVHNVRGVGYVLRAGA